MKVIRYIVTGRVQGVGFRYFVLRQAEALGGAGWVRNRTDGSVEALIRSTDAQHLEIRQRLNEGPRWSLVERVDETEMDDVDLSPGFEILSDGA